MNKIVITGYGIAVPGSHNGKQFEKQLRKGIHGIKSFNDEHLPQNKTLSLGYLDPIVFDREEKSYKKYPRVSKVQINTTDEAIKMSGIDLSKKKTGVFIGTSLGGTEGYEANIPISNKGDYKSFPNSAIGETNFQSTAAAINGHLKLTGIAKTIATGCTASMEALETACIYIKSGIIDTAIVGGVDIANTPGLLYAFSKIRSLPLGHELEQSGLPFSKNSKGFVAAEGSASLVIEREEDAVKRGGVILAEIDDVQSNNDGLGVFGSDPTGKHMLKLSKEIVANKNPDYVNSQALGLRPSDELEANNHRLLFDNQIPITSIKGMVGHAFGASGLIQVIASLIGMQGNFIPYTARTDYVGHETLNIMDRFQERKVSEVLITCHGYGGNNSVAYIKKHSVKGD
ncbi:beta-ketoacyl synthase N-terminal-like domain-containing protein [Salinibacillus xinjiangensis]|uniref:Beta-ketoacyl synthase n=1 Tax=Salinibacillus xinjiangensis TaxID=1229268 RepID=A0A6G1X2T3_9BACI|nr:beta-ketoacyl synthase N-terminal-like domain-containing protein [Salinibacillus xinjiangensis]MRG85254.1 beta-ketoacyl synthase [Salinibacillus xinjiangensis]